MGEEQTQLLPTTHSERQEMRREGRLVFKNDVVRLADDIDRLEPLFGELVEALERIKRDKCYCYYHHPEGEGDYECPHEVAGGLLARAREAQKGAPCAQH